MRVLFSDQNFLFRHCLNLLVRLSALKFSTQIPLRATLMMLRMQKSVRRQLPDWHQARCPSLRRKVRAMASCALPPVRMLEKRWSISMRKAMSHQCQSICTAAARVTIRPSLISNSFSPPPCPSSMSYQLSRNRCEMHMSGCEPSSSRSKWLDRICTSEVSQLTPVFRVRRHRRNSQISSRHSEKCLIYV